MTHQARRLSTISTYKALSSTFTLRFVTFASLCPSFTTCGLTSLFYAITGSFSGSATKAISLIPLLFYAAPVSTYSPPSIPQPTLSLLLHMRRYQRPPTSLSKPSSVHTSTTIPPLWLEPSCTLHYFVPWCCFASLYLFLNTHLPPGRLRKRLTFQTSQSARYRTSQGLELPIIGTAITDESSPLYELRSK